MINGFFISEVSLTGEDKKDATIKFKDGLNVIYGASDTGKSYILECINFCLGASNRPKLIKESEGYSIVSMTIIHRKTGHKYSIRRKLENGEINVLDIEGGSSHSMYQKSTQSGPKQSLSDFLLSLCGLNDIYILKTQKKDRTQIGKLSFRDMSRMLLVNEEKIFSSNSPVKTGDALFSTREESAFKAIITGDDRSALEKRDSLKLTVKELVEGILYLKKYKSDISNQVKEMKKESTQKRGRKTYSPYNTKTVIRDLIKISDELDSLLKEKKENKKELYRISSEIALKQDLISRFTILMDTYRSDLKRLHFLQEGGELFEQLIVENCVVCGNKFSHEKDCSVDLDENFKRALMAEYEKLNVMLKDLEGTMDETKNELDKLLTEKNNLDTLTNNLEIHINSELKPLKLVLEDKIKDIKEYSGIDSKIEYLVDKKESINKEITEKEEKLQHAKNELMTYKESNINFLDDEAAFSGVCAKVKTLLDGWFSKDYEILFDSKKFDITKDGYARGSSGKGIKGLTLSAFIVGLMLYCNDEKLKHPFFVVIDSPITGHLGKIKNKNNPESVDVSVQENFFESLSMQKNMQIIIIENKLPNEKIREKMNFVHYSGDGDGFIHI